MNSGMTVLLTAFGIETSINQILSITKDIGILPDTITLVL